MGHIVLLKHQDFVERIMKTARLLDPDVRRSCQQVFNRYRGYASSALSYEDLCAEALLGVVEEASPTVDFACILQKVEDYAKRNRSVVSGNRSGADVPLCIGGDDGEGRELLNLPQFAVEDVLTGLVREEDARLAQGVRVRLSPDRKRQGKRNERANPDADIREAERVRVEKFRTILSRLPEDRQEIFRRHCFGGESLQDLADMFGVTANSLYSWIFRFRERLRRELYPLDAPKTAPEQILYRDMVSSQKSKNRLEVPYTVFAAEYDAAMAKVFPKPRAILQARLAGESVEDVAIRFNVQTRRVYDVCVTAKRVIRQHMEGVAQRLPNPNLR